MRIFRAARLSFAAALILGLSGCSEKSGVEEQTKIIGPEGTTTITKDTKVESSGKNPPVVAEPGSPESSTPKP